MNIPLFLVQIDKEEVVDIYEKFKVEK